MAEAKYNEKYSKTKKLVTNMLQMLRDLGKLDVLISFAKCIKPCIKLLISTHISGFYAFENIFRIAEEELQDQALMADVQLDVDLKTAASKAFEEARLLVTETLTTAPVPSVSKLRIGCVEKP